MPDPIKVALAALGTAFAAGAAWMTQKHRVDQVKQEVNARIDQVKHDLNAMGRHRVKDVEEGLTKYGARLDEHREQTNSRDRESLEREARLRERVRALEIETANLRAEVARILAGA